MDMSIPEFYRGRSVFITGFTGYIGKLIAEKLLYSCPDVKKIYVLIRNKQNKTVQERAKEVLASMAFDRVRQKYPDVLESKIVAVAGDILEEKLGLSHEDEELIRREVTVIFHGAASVRFDDTLSQAIKQNTVGAKKIVDLALTMPKLACLMYISTAYSNCDELYIKEQMYPPKADWKKTVEICDKIDLGTQQILLQKYMGIMPNTYVFSKSLAEDVINDYRNELPVAIARPSIVVPAWKEPQPGWTDNKYGPLALILGFLFGVLRCGWVDTAQKSNYIFSDIVVNAVIVASWKTALTYDAKAKPEAVTVYNVCSPTWINMDNEEFSLIYLKGNTVKHLSKDGINLISLWFASNPLWYRINVLMRHVISAALIDMYLMLSKKNPILLKVRMKVFQATAALSYFARRTFIFEDDKFSRLCDEIKPEDKEAFSWDFKQCDTYKIYDDAFLVTKKTLLKPLYDNFEANRKRLRLLYLVDHSVVYLLYLIFFYLMYAYSIPQIMFSRLLSIVYL